MQGGGFQGQPMMQGGGGYGGGYQQPMVQGGYQKGYVQPGYVQKPGVVYQ